ncbi:MAG: hypothetical protein RL519_794 [Pseudomonadota bacterium]
MISSRVFVVAGCRALIRLLVLLLLVSGPIAAEEGEPITVTAPARSDGLLRRQVSQFSRQIADTTGQEQFARRGSTYCPKVIGLPEPFSKVMLVKLEDGAKATRKVQSAPAGCRPDVFIIFTEDSGDLLDRIKQKNPKFFGALQADAAARLFKGPRAVKWWYATELKGSDGEPVVDGAIYRTRSSLISSGISLNLASTVVLVDVGLADGFPLDSIASYVTMIVFAQIRVSNGQLATSPSILGMFDRAAPRLSALRGLTIWDQAYLRALYQIPPDRPLWQQRSQLEAAIVRAIREAEGVAQ